MSEAMVQDRIDAMIRSGNEEANALLERLQQDYIHDEVIGIGPGSDAADRVAILNDGASLAFQGDDERFRQLHPHAATQLGEKLGLPGRWLREVTSDQAAGWKRELAADAIQTYLSNTRERNRLLFRSVDQTIRGVLSDHYRRLSSPMVAAGFAVGIQRSGAQPYKAWTNDLKWQLRAIMPESIQIRSPHHPTEFIGAACVLENSDFGAGALELYFEVLRIWCTNGAIGMSRMRQVHLGRKLPDDLRLTQETYEADSKAQALLVRDTVAGVLERGQIERRLQPVIHSASQEVEDVEAEVGKLARARRMTKAEIEGLNQKLMQRDGGEVPEGRVTRWSLSQAISSLANESSHDRARDLQRAAGELIGID